MKFAPLVVLTLGAAPAFAQVVTCDDPEACEEAAKAAAVRGKLKLAQALRLRALDLKDEQKVEGPSEASAPEQRQVSRNPEPAPSGPRPLNLMDRADLWLERTRLRSERPDIGGPIALLLCGVVAAAGGTGGLLTQSHGQSDGPAFGALISAGAVAAVAGTVWLILSGPGRFAADRDIAAIDRELAHRGVDVEAAEGSSDRPARSNEPHTALRVIAQLVGYAIAVVLLGGLSLGLRH
jgi:hypothetical protein